MKKKFYNRNIRKKDIKEVRSFLRTFGVGLRIMDLGKGQEDSTGTYSGDLKYIKINDLYKYSIREFLSTTFHELAHIIFTQEEKYKIYHKPAPRIFTKKERAHVIKHGLKAEIDVDKFGHKLMKTFFPTIPYAKCYRDQYTKDSWRKWAKLNYGD